MDITAFMTWFVSQVVSIFSKVFNTLDNITFSGTSILKVLVTIMILSALLGVVLTLSKDVSVIGSKSERVKEKKTKKDNKSKGGKK